MVREYNVRTSDFKSGIIVYFLKKKIYLFLAVFGLSCNMGTFVEEVCRLLSCGGSQAPEHTASVFGGPPPQ